MHRTIIFHSERQCKDHAMKLQEFQTKILTQVGLEIICTYLELGYEKIVVGKQTPYRFLVDISPNSLVILGTS